MINRLMKLKLFASFWDRLNKEKQSSGKPLKYLMGKYFILQDFGSHLRLYQIKDLEKRDILLDFIPN